MDILRGWSCCRIDCKGINTQGYLCSESLSQRGTQSGPFLFCNFQSIFLIKLRYKHKRLKLRCGRPSVKNISLTVHRLREWYLSHQRMEQGWWLTRMCWIVMDRTMTQMVWNKGQRMYWFHWDRINFLLSSFPWGYVLDFCRKHCG